jgi:hypothetical protein
MEVCASCPGGSCHRKVKKLSFADHIAMKPTHYAMWAKGVGGEGSWGNCNCRPRAEGAACFAVHDNAYLARSVCSLPNTAVSL